MNPKNQIKSMTTLKFHMHTGSIKSIINKKLRPILLCKKIQIVFYFHVTYLDYTVEQHQLGKLIKKFF